MLQQILSRTPPWVFALFVVLLLFGILQSRSRQLGVTRIEGSWTPLAVMMLTFFTRYAIAVALAIQPALAASPWLAPGVAFAYGLMSGAFLPRALRILGAARPAEVPA